MEIKPLDTLHEWDENPKLVDKDGYERLKKQLSLGQHSTLLVMDDGTVIGGNTRLKAMKELGIKTAECKILSFKEEPGMGWYAVLDGVKVTVPNSEIVPKYYKRPEDGMMEYSLSHNDMAGYYSSDIMANVMPQYNIDYSQFAVSFEPPKNLGELSKIDVDSVFPDKKTIVCPKCGHEFTPT